MRESCLSSKADEIHGYADRHAMNNFYDALKEVYGPTSPGPSPLLSADRNTRITEKDKILERWADHIHSVLSRPSSINSEAIDRLPAPR